MFISNVKTIIIKVIIYIVVISLFFDVIFISYNVSAASQITSSKRPSELSVHFLNRLIDKINLIS